MNDPILQAQRIAAFEQILYASKAEDLKRVSQEAEANGPVVDQALKDTLGVPLLLGPHQNKIISLLTFCVEQYDKLGLRAERDMLAEQIKKEFKLGRKE